MTSNLNFPLLKKKIRWKSIFSTLISQRLKDCRCTLSSTSFAFRRNYRFCVGDFDGGEGFNQLKWFQCKFYDTTESVVVVMMVMVEVDNTEEEEEELKNVRNISRKVF